MRFSLTFISATMLASLAMAAPAVPQDNNADGQTETGSAQMATLEVGEQFQPFNWKTEGDSKAVDRKFTLDLAEPALLQITDYKLGGDQFEILDNGQSLGMTSQVEGQESAYAATPEEAIQDDRFSHATFDLAQGKHEITVKVAESPYADGTGAMRVVQKVQALYKDKKKGGKGGKGKKGGNWEDDKDNEWEDDKDDDWEDDDDWDDDDEDDDDDDDDKDGWDDDKKGRWGDDKKGRWDNNKKGDWDDDKKGDWDDDKKGDWDDDKKGGWDDDKKGGWDDDKKGGWDDDKKGDWHDDKKGGWHDDKKTVYVYYTVSPKDQQGEYETKYVTTTTGAALETATVTSDVIVEETETVLLAMPFMTL